MQPQLQVYCNLSSNYLRPSSHRAHFQCQSKVMFILGVLNLIMDHRRQGIFANLHLLATYAYIDIFTVHLKDCVAQLYSVSPSPGSDVARLFAQRRSKSCAPNEIAHTGSRAHNNK